MVKLQIWQLGYSLEATWWRSFDVEMDEALAMLEVEKEEAREAASD